jgi:hypothetical protein
MTTATDKHVAPLADAFLRKLRAHLGDDVMRGIAALNADEPNPAICHTHDYCDANVIMDQAFVAVLGRRSRSNSDRDAVVWTRAWNLAKERMQRK